MTPEKVLGIYKDLQKLFPRDQKSQNVTDLLEIIAVDSIKVLERVPTVELTTSLTGKTYFSFQGKDKLSRPVNRSLFVPDISYLKRLFLALRSRSFDSWSVSELTSGWYTTAISFCCLTDAFKTRDQKTPATYFEYLMGHILASILECNPKKQLDVLSGDLSAKLPTDFIFDLGEKETKFHVPVKTSTRERVIQVWAHQRVLDGIYGIGRYRGILTCLNETKLDHKTRDVVEICLPDQWRIYQMFIAKLERIYYLDTPIRYAQLRNEYPRIEVRSFGEFFKEYKELLA